jgi:ABC-type multidrug transport system ATPase subunit
MDEAERCNEVAYIYLSKLMVRGTPGELKALPEVSPEGTRRIAIETSHPPRALSVLKQQAYALDATLVEAEVHLLMPVDTSEAQVLADLADSGTTDASTRAIEPSLEDVFVTLTRRLARR